MPVPSDVGKMFKFCAGPYAGCVFTVEMCHEENHISDIRFAQYNKKLVITNNEWVQWGAKQL